MRRWLNDLYYGHGQTRFGLAYVVVDLLIIAFFIVAPLARDEPWFLAADYAVAFLLSVDFAARAYATPGLRAWLRNPIVWVDAVILLTMLAPQYFANFGFLRVLRLWTLANSPLFWRTVSRGRYRDIDPSEDGLLRAHYFPGLWLDPQALWDPKQSLRPAIEQGIQTPGHAAFDSLHDR